MNLQQRTLIIFCNFLRNLNNSRISSRVSAAASAFLLSTLFTRIKKKNFLRNNIFHFDFTEFYHKVSISLQLFLKL